MGSCEAGVELEIPQAAADEINPKIELANLLLRMESQRLHSSLELLLIGMWATVPVGPLSGDFWQVCELACA